MTAAWLRKSEMIWTGRKSQKVKGKKVKEDKSKSEKMRGEREGEHLLSRDKMKVGEIES